MLYANRFHFYGDFTEPRILLTGLIVTKHVYYSLATLKYFVNSYNEPCKEVIC